VHKIKRDYKLEESKNGQILSIDFFKRFLLTLKKQKSKCKVSVRGKHSGSLRKLSQ
jgi:hypothetical protein